MKDIQMINLDESKAKLELRLKELTERAEDIEEDLSERGDDDWSEHAVEVEDDEVLEGVGNLAQDEMRHIKLALEKINKGTYGFCSSCKESIAEKRLAAVPYASLCMNCSSDD